VPLEQSHEGAGGHRLPLLAPWWRVVDDGDRILFEHGGRMVELRGRAVQALLPVLLPLLDGAHTRADILRRLGSAAAPSVDKALVLLDDHGLLTEGPDVEEDAASRYVASVCVGTTVSSAHERLTHSRVGVWGGSLAAAEVVPLLESAGVATTASVPDDPADLDLLVAAPAPDQVAALDDVNARRLDDGVPWLAVLPHDGRVTTVGPLVVPGQTACHACFLARRGATSGYEPDADRVHSHPVTAPAPDAIGVAVAAIAALLALRWLAARDPTLPGVAFAFETGGDPALTRHRVLRVPRCPACGPDGPPPNPWFKEIDARDARQPVHSGR
jgi:bacteriocin biosynthesis cyclodehydratase domain-containing protein